MITGLLYNSIEKQTTTSVSFNKTRCLRSRLNSSVCDLCVSLCKKNAVEVRGGEILFREDKCTECMACVSGCPNEAFFSDFDMRSFFPLLRGKENTEPVVLACRKSSHHANQLKIPCIGLLSEPALAAMQCIASNDFYLDVHRCADCRNGHVLALLYERIERIIKKKGAAADLRIRYINEKNFHTAASGKERRLFLRMATNSLIDLSREASGFIGPRKNQAPQKIADEKKATANCRLLKQALDLLPQDAVQERKLLRSYNYTLTSNGSCDLCPACSGMCPTGALKRQNNNKTKHLIFTSSRCSGCGLCVSFCKKKALALLPGVQNDPNLALSIA